MTKKELIEQGWSHVHGDPRYMVTTDGRVLSSAKGEWKELLGDINNLGYRRVRIGRCARVFVHRLVAEHFLERPDGLNVVNHINLNKLDNSVANLEWCTQKRNIAHAVKSGVFRPPRGEAHYSAIHKECVIRSIRKHHQENPLERYVDVAKKFDITRQEARAIILRKSWKHVSD